MLYLRLGDLLGLKVQCRHHRLGNLLGLEVQYHRLGDLPGPELHCRNHRLGDSRRHLCQAKEQLRRQDSIPQALPVPAAHQ